jgi:hypothetical protein
MWVKGVVAMGWIVGLGGAMLLAGLLMAVAEFMKGVQEGMIKQKIRARRKAEEANKQ